MPDLTDTETRMLDFERQWWKYPGAKEAAIRERFDLSPVGYYKTLNGLLDRPEAAAHDVMLVKRLRRLREQRTAQRAAARVSLAD